MVTCLRTQLYLTAIVAARESMPPLVRIMPPRVNIMVA